MRPSDLKKKIIERNPGVILQVKRDLGFQVALHIEEARLLKGYTQKQLADKIGTHQANIARAERGSTLPSLTFLEKIAQAFDTYLIPPRFAFMEGTQRATVTTAGGEAKNDYGIYKTPLSSVAWGFHSGRTLTQSHSAEAFATIRH